MLVGIIARWWGKSTFFSKKILVFNRIKTGFSQIGDYHGVYWRNPQREWKIFGKKHDKRQRRSSQKVDAPTKENGKSPILRGIPTMVKKTRRSFFFDVLHKVIFS